MALEGRYAYQEVEPRLQQAWADRRIYAFNPTSPLPLYSIDTPPPTISGQIHIGHVYSYTQADIIARYQRLRGRSVFYPFGFDDNGLPTERFTEQVRGVSAREIGRAAFIEACLQVSAEMEERFERFWRRLGLSVDWRLRYSTIDARSRRISQRSFIDLYRRGKVQRRKAPTLWCPLCQTSLAQADVEDRDAVTTTFVTIAFTSADGRSLPIATTRPELLPACIAVFVHPEDERYADWIGTEVLVPIFGQSVPVLANAEAQPAKGSGAVMCCTFGDASDVRWWHQFGMPLRSAILPDGTMSEIAGNLAGLTIAAARAEIIGNLETRGLLLDRETINHSVGVHERCGTPVEYLVSAQWFLGVIELREELLELGRQVQWHPAHMRVRYDHWVSGLTWDWNISRQRSYGVPIPVWYCRRCDAVTLAAESQLPIDPAVAAPLSACSACGGGEFRHDPDVLDTWATSSLTPEICASLAADHGMAAAVFLARPMDLRPNAHDIIRTWDFYTIVRSLLDRARIPWREVMIAGHALNQEGLKLSKSRLPIGSDPTGVIESYSADAVRYWTAGARMGTDASVTEDAFRQGSRLVTKLWNAARFVLQYQPIRPLEGDDTPFVAEGLLPADRWILAHLGRSIAQVGESLDQFEPAAARTAIEQFFWSDFCDTYLELVKYRLNRHSMADGTRADETERMAAILTLRCALLEVLKLLAPIMPFVTDEIYSRGFASDQDPPSIHQSSWPDSENYRRFDDALVADDVLPEIVDQVRRYKSAQALSVGASLAELTVYCPPRYLSLLNAMRLDLACITRAAALHFRSGDGEHVSIDARR